MEVSVAETSPVYQLTVQECNVERLVIRLPSSSETEPVQFRTLKICSSSREAERDDSSGAILTLILDGEIGRVQHAIHRDSDFCFVGRQSLVLSHPDAGTLILHFRTAEKRVELQRLLDRHLERRTEPCSSSASAATASPRELDNSIGGNAFLCEASSADLGAVDLLGAADVDAHTDARAPAVADEGFDGMTEVVETSFNAVAPQTEFKKTNRTRRFRNVTDESRVAVLQSAEKSGVERAAHSYGVKKKTLYDWISHKLGSPRQFSVQIGERCPAAVQSELVGWIRARQSRILLSDAVTKAQSLTRKHSSQFSPSPKWTARLCIRFGLLDRLSDSLAQLLEVAEIPEGPFRILKESAEPSGKLPWTVRREIIHFALETSVRTASALFGLPKSTVAEWVNKRSTSAVQTPLGRKLTYGKKADDMVLAWFMEEFSLDRTPSDKQVQDKARQIIRPEQPTFKASRKWLVGFYQRHQISTKITKKEPPSASDPPVNEAGTGAEEGSIGFLLGELLAEFCTVPLGSPPQPVASS